MFYGGCATPCNPFCLFFLLSFVPITAWTSNRHKTNNMTKETNHSDLADTIPNKSDSSIIIIAIQEILLAGIYPFSICLIIIPVLARNFIDGFMLHNGAKYARFFMRIPLARENAEINSWYAHPKQYCKQAGSLEETGLFQNIPRWSINAANYAQSFVTHKQKLIT